MTVRRTRHLSLVTAHDLPAWSAGPSGGADVFAAAAGAGYDGVQVFVPAQGELARTAGLSEVSALFPARSVADVEGVLTMWADGGASSVTLHLGTGFETRRDGAALVEATLSASQRFAVPVLVETHRATLFQDPARALELVDEFPDLRFTADLSHWYTGVEMVYGEFDEKLEALQPVFDRCRMIHGRISDPGCIQVAVADDDTSDHVAHFRRMWTAIEDACSAADVETLPFVVELLGPRQHYARTVERGNGREEECDRWTQADVLWRLFDSASVPQPSGA